MLSQKKVLVIGLALSGKAAIRLLEACNATITVNVSDQKDKIEDYDLYIERGIEVVCGGHPDELFERDFDFVVKNPGVKYNLPFIKRLKERNIPIYTEIELAYQIAKPQKYLAVTGTNGKTTTVHLMYEVCKKAFKHVHLAGNVGFALCDIVMDHNLMENSGHCIILEMSNFQLLDISKFSPFVSTVLNLKPDHLDYMETLEEYYDSKFNIYQNQTEGYYVLNLDDELVVQHLNKFPLKCKPLTFGFDKGDCYSKSGAIYFKEERIIDLKQIHVVGKHNIYNIMTVICFVKAMGVDNELLLEVLSNFKGVEHRIEYVSTVEGVKVYNDSKATNVDATITALQAFDKPTILLLGGFDKNLDVTPLLQYFKHVKHLICFGVAGERFKNDLNYKHSSYAYSLKQAYHKALELSSTGDVILLSPSTSSYDEFKSFEHRGECFKQYVNE